MIALIERWLFVTCEDGGRDLHADGCRVPGRHVLQEGRLSLVGNLH